MAKTLLENRYTPILQGGTQLASHTHNSSNKIVEINEEKYEKDENHGRKEWEVHADFLQRQHN